jgi:HPt (histidine-containing phosphotransfer) domain-containing protein
MDDPQKLQEMLATLWEQHRPAIEERINILAQACEALRCGRLTTENREEALSAAHKLAGVLGTFGRTEGTDLARRIENWLADAETLSSRSRDFREALLSLRNTIN